MKENESLSYDKLSKLSFDSKIHRYILDGLVVPGVTDLINRGYPKSEALVKWQIKQGIEEYETGKKLKEAASIGSYAHLCAKLTEEEDKKSLEDLFQKIPSTTLPLVTKCYNAFLEWKKENKDSNIQHEKIIANRGLQYAGTFDRLCFRKNKVIISEVKTTRYIYITHFIQLALYKLALKDWLNEEVDGLEVIRFGKDGKFETKLITSLDKIKEIESQALRVIETYSFRKQYENQK